MKFASKRGINIGSHVKEILSQVLNSKYKLIFYDIERGLTGYYMIYNYKILQLITYSR